MFFGGRSSIGLDIGSGYLKVVQLKDTKGGYELELFDTAAPPSLSLEFNNRFSSPYRFLKELARKAKSGQKMLLSV
jgi:Tfp pilus assembly PilM family ATPase